MSVQPSTMPAAEAVAADRAFFGHPRALSTLFFTEMWERFSYYGMRALLILFMTAAVADGGLGFEASTAGAIYGLYTAAVYLLALPGGWLADRLWGQQRAVLIGGAIIAAGHFTLLFPGTPTFFLGLVLIAVGTGLLKPNISTIVGALYSQDDARRDAGFSLFYMGINLGGFAAPALCGFLGEKVDWHYGFAAAGFGMVLGLVQYVYGRRYLGAAGQYRPSGLPAAAEEKRVRRIYLGLGLAFAAAAAFAFLLWSGILPVTVVALANGAAVGIVALSVFFFLYLFLAGGLTSGEKRRLGVVAVLFLFSVTFWAGFEQAGSTFSLFARDMTDRTVLGWTFPASWFQVVNSFFILLLAPAFAVLWVRLGRRQPSVPAKLAWGLLLLAAGFAVIMLGARLAAAGGRVGVGWLLGVYFLHTCGELCLSPIGLGTVTRLAPQRYAGQTMGVWFISIALGNLVAGLLAGRLGTLAMADLFLGVAVVAAVAGVIMVFLVRPLRRMMAAT